jgi:hypothetical protein
VQYPQTGCSVTSAAQRIMPVAARAQLGTDMACNSECVQRYSGHTTVTIYSPSAHCAAATHAGSVPWGSSSSSSPWLASTRSTSQCSAWHMTTHAVVRADVSLTARFPIACSSLLTLQVISYL